MQCTYFIPRKIKNSVSQFDTYMPVRSFVEFLIFKERGSLQAYNYIDSIIFFLRYGQVSIYFLIPTIAKLRYHALYYSCFLPAVPFSFHWYVYMYCTHICTLTTTSIVYGFLFTSTCRESVPSEQNKEVEKYHLIYINAIMFNFRLLEGALLCSQKVQFVKIRLQINAHISKFRRPIKSKLSQLIG